jgi:hypothetical protein
LWAVVIEKAYAYCRAGANTFASLNFGSTAAVSADLGLPTTLSWLPGSADVVYQLVLAATQSHQGLTFGTPSTVAGGAPLVGSHAYTLISATLQNGVYTFYARNPWGFDGAGNDGNTSDGIVAITWAQLQQNFGFGITVSG